MAFMQIATLCDTWYAVETRNGTDYVPASVCGSLPIPVGEECGPEDSVWEYVCQQVHQYCEGKPLSVECIGEQWAARYSAPGYMDCTDWVLADTEEEAVAECQSMYGSEEEEEEEIS